MGCCMVAKCANPSCSRSFRYLGEGRPPAPPASISAETSRATMMTKSSCVTLRVLLRPLPRGSNKPCHRVELPFSVA
jgi:hypothetical protein